MYERRVIPPRPREPAGSLVVQRPNHMPYLHGAGDFACFDALRARAVVYWDSLETILMSFVIEKCF